MYPILAQGLCSFLEDASRQPKVVNCIKLEACFLSKQKSRPFILVFYPKVIPALIPQAFAGLVICRLDPAIFKRRVANSARRKKNTSQLFRPLINCFTNQKQFGRRQNTSGDKFPTFIASLPPERRVSFSAVS
jgi:hypothetical protein